MKNKNSKKFSPLTFLAIAVGVVLALTDDYIVEYFGKHPTLGIIFIAALIFAFIYLIGFKNLKKSCSN